jgi:hypothetical protein
MSTLVNSFLSWFFKKRIGQIQYSVANPIETQEEVFRNLIKKGQKTAFGKFYGFDKIDTYEAYKSAVPVQDYEQLKPYITRILEGEQQVLWPSEIKWFAKSSGTTSDKSKFIPVSFEALDECQFQGARDLVTQFCHLYPDTKIFEGKSLMIGGSHEVNKLSSDSFYGDLSAVMMNNLPFWVNMLRTPRPEIALMPDWEDKMEKMAHATLEENVTSISGVPTWTILLMKRVMELKNADTIHDVWPNLELFMHGGVNFDPYKSEFEKLTRGKKIHFMESYNASEGFFGIQDTLFGEENMLLMPNYGVFYEFIPIQELHKDNPISYSLAEVETGTTYALLISTNAGLWRYAIGDTLEFTSLKPFRFKIKGRTKLFINAFGEELMIENAEKAITLACQETASSVFEFTAAPKYISNGQKGAHEWWIEFKNEPEDLNLFTQTLDKHLKSVNSDYEAKRAGDLALGCPIIHSCKPGTFYAYMKERNKLGGQHKVPRLSNDRKIVTEIKALSKNL